MAWCARELVRIEERRRTLLRGAIGRGLPGRESASGERRSGTEQDRQMQFVKSPDALGSEHNSIRRRLPEGLTGLRSVAPAPNRRRNLLCVPVRVDPFNGRPFREHR